MFYTHLNQAQAEQLRRLNEGLRAQVEQQASFAGGINRDAHAFWGQQSAPPRPRSRFDTPDVIDMVQGADGVWRAPEHLEYRARER